MGRSWIRQAEIIALIPAGVVAVVGLAAASMRRRPIAASRPTAFEPNHLASGESHSVPGRVTYVTDTLWTPATFSTTASRSTALAS